MSPQVWTHLIDSAALTAEEREHLSPWWWESLREGAADPRYDLLALVIF